MEKPAFEKKHDFLVCIDSDGCMFDVMEVKHKECFCPAAVEHFGLQPVSKYARDAWDFVNLYSVWRGIHRLLALLKALDLLGERREVKERGFTPPRLETLRAYVADGGELSNAGLKAYLEEHPEAEDIRTTIAWSEDVNQRIARMVHGVPPFPWAREGLEMLAEKADVVVVSATQEKAVEREWTEHGLMKHLAAVCGQERGNKRKIIDSLKGAYAPDHVLMIGDAPGDRDAAHATGALFYPILPDAESESWRMLTESADAFFNGRYAGEMERGNIARFEATLPTVPFWDK